MQVLLFLAAGLAPILSDDLIHTTREFYFDLPDGCPVEGMCLEGFSLILTFDVGVTMQDEIREADFREVDLEFGVKQRYDQSAQQLTFTRYEKSFDRSSKKLHLVLYPDALPNDRKAAVLKCVFDGQVKEKGGTTGKLVFYLRSGSTYTVNYN